MALISCPECAKQVASSAASCPNCGAPIAARVESAAAGAPLQTIQETSKKLKVQILIAAALFWGGLVVMFTSTGNPNLEGNVVFGMLLMLVGFVFYVGTKARIWWHHK